MDTSSMIAILVIVGGAVFGVLGALHALLHCAGSSQPATARPRRSRARWRIRPSGYPAVARTCGEPGLVLTSATVSVYCYSQHWRSGSVLTSACCPRGFFQR